MSTGRVKWEGEVQVLPPRHSAHWPSIFRGLTLLEGGYPLPAILEITEAKEERWSQDREEREQVQVQGWQLGPQSLQKWCFDL